MKLFGVTTTFNCEALVPYVMKYYSDLGYDKVIVYDNESTDNTVELLKQYPFAEIRTFSHNEFAVNTFTNEGCLIIGQNEILKRTTLTNTLWEIYYEYIGSYIEGKTEPAWITLTDFDEVIFFSSIYGRTFKYYLDEITSLGYNVCYEKMLWLVGTQNSYDTNEFIHRQINKCAFGEGGIWTKPLLFRLDNLYILNLALGQHGAYFKFFNEDVKPLSNTRSIHVFHLKYALGNPIYFWTDIIANHYNETLKNTIDIKTYFEHKMLNGVEAGESENIYLSQFY